MYLQRKAIKEIPLPVVFTEDELDLSLYEKIAREFGYSETSFVCYSRDEKVLKVRSFTPIGFEVNGAGHNLLGAVHAAIGKGMDVFSGQNGEPFVIMKDEAIRLFIDSDGPGELTVVGMQQQPAVIGPAVKEEEIAGALGINASDLLTDNFSPVVVKTEVAHLMVAIKSRKVLEKIIPVKKSLSDIARRTGFEGVYCFTLTGDTDHIAEVRFFNPGMGIDEDAATGSAAGPLAGLLYQKKYVEKDREYQILQGVKMKQPSIIKFRINDQGVLISGTSVVTMQGFLYK